MINSLLTEFGLTMRF